ncbi:hypothetical protein BN946_scf184801.g55 [Trametes cinnabarina]|uniref:AMP-dependent synthetase/ligase domain-containing protein n=1 Tax=Pycnoporus cinnabarinus TaxID=5643 RepID=A0A060S8R5_PYCCI|nr:hypothetical protein BN946_scf184801.g55 [Trametes cinnabarina]
MPEFKKINDLPVQLPPNADYNKQTVAVPGTERPGQTGKYLANLVTSAERNTESCVRVILMAVKQSTVIFDLITLDSPGVFSNLLEVWDEGYRRSKGGPFLAHRPVISKKPLQFANYYVWQSWPEVAARRSAIGSAVHRMFLDGQLGGRDMDTVGIWSKNCPSEGNCADWLIVDLALQAYGKVSVPLYDTLGADSVEMTVIFAAPEHIPFLLTIAPKLKTLKMIVSLEALSDEEKTVLSTWGKTQKLKVMDLGEGEFETSMPPCTAHKDGCSVLRLQWRNLGKPT